MVRARTFPLILSLLVASFAMAESQAPKTACQEPARTACVNSCVSDFCRASCESSYCGEEQAPPWGPFAGPLAPDPNPAPATDGFPDLTRNDVQCDNGLSDTMKNTIIPIYQENDLLDTYHVVFDAWGCSLVPKGSASSGL